MTLLTVVKDVCATVGVQVPSTVFGGIANNRTMQEMLSLANEMAQRIAYDTRDWTRLRALANCVGDGVAIQFPLPANFKRMLLTTNVRTTVRPTQPVAFVASEDEWLESILNNQFHMNGQWIISGGALHIRPPLPAGAVAHYLYLDKNCVALASGGTGDAFMADTDTFLLDERLLKLGMVWQWKAQKGSPYAEDMGSYSDALANAMGHDAPAPIIIDRRPMSHHNRGVAYPWPIPT
jgi:hypothetical protein